MRARRETRDVAGWCGATMPADTCPGPLRAARARGLGFQQRSDEQMETSGEELDREMVEYLPTGVELASEGRR